MEEKEYNTYLRQISEAKVGLEMVNHCESCPDCVKLLNIAQINIFKHMEKIREKN